MNKIEPPPPPQQQQPEQTKKLSPQQQNDPLSMSRLNPKLIRRVLLTDPSEFSSLTVTGEPVLEETPSFGEFSRGLDNKDSPSAALQAAYRDHLVAFMSVEPPKKLLLELHGSIRLLVPNRKDLHGILKDDAVSRADTKDNILSLLIHAAKALQQLESVARSETTQDWIVLAISEQMDDTKKMLSFLVTSTLYLIFKTELCHQDKQNFFLAGVLAPKIHREGVQELKRLFEARYGQEESNSDFIPRTKKWVRALMEAQSSEKSDSWMLQDDTQQQNRRKEWLRRAWVQDILFRSSEALPLPEAFQWDVDDIREVRETTRRVAAGSALALHAKNMARPEASFPNDPTSPVELRRQDLFAAMMTHDKTGFEQSVADAVIALAKAWNKDLSETEVLRSRTTAVLRGQDPVMDLLDKRMRDAFIQLVGMEIPSKTPSQMKSGILSKNNKKDKSGSFVKEAEAEFSKRGLPFYASELALCCHGVRKMMDLTEKVCGDVLDKVVKDAWEEHKNHTVPQCG